MTDGEKTLTREERLAARLRENLHRRKAQARALSGAQGGIGAGSGKDAGDTGALPKDGAKS